MRSWYHKGWAVITSPHLFLLHTHQNTMKHAQDANDINTAVSLLGPVSVHWTPISGDTLGFTVSRPTLPIVALHAEELSLCRQVCWSHREHGLTVHQSLWTLNCNTWQPSPSLSPCHSLAPLYFTSLAGEIEVQKTPLNRIPTPCRLFP